MTTGIPHYDALTAIAAMITGLSSGSPPPITGLTGGVVLQEMPWYEKGLEECVLPFISISPFGQEESADWTVQTDTLSYPIFIAIIAQPGLDQLSNHLNWRYQILRRIRNASFSPAIAQSYQITPKPGPICDPVAWRERKLWVSTMTAMCAIYTSRSG